MTSLFSNFKGYVHVLCSFQNWVLGLFLLRELYIMEINLWFELQIFLFYCLSLGFVLFMAESVFFFNCYVLERHYFIVS